MKGRKVSKPLKIVMIAFMNREKGVSAGGYSSREAVLTETHSHARRDANLRTWQTRAARLAALDRPSQRVQDGALSLDVFSVTTLNMI